MKKILTILLLFVSLISSATNYYVKTGGSDAANGLTDGTAWETLSKVSGATFAGGDTILFNRGDTWVGTLTVHNSGTAGNLITYGAYGTGADPIITGFTSVTAWSDLGSNIWESTAAVSTLTTCNMVVIGGVNTAMGREPEVDANVYTFQTHDANNSITSTDLSGTPDWTGAQVVIRKESWIWQVGTITDQSTGTISYTDGGTFTPTNDWGFFIQNDSLTLDTQDEWYYSPSRKKIMIYSTSEPSNVKVTTVEKLLSSVNKNYVTIENISFIGSNTTSVYVEGGTNFTVSNCTINYNGLHGVHLFWPSYATVDSSVIKNSNYAAIWAQTQVNYATISNNTIDSTTMINGVGTLVYAPGSIYFAGGDYVTITGNNIDHSGYDGILVAHDHGTISNNFINNSVLKRSDGGGIYVGGTYVDLVIDNNIVLNSLGDTDGTNGTGAESMGIYLDAWPENITVTDNTCAYNETTGIYLNLGANTNTISGNTCYANSASQFRVENYSDQQDTYDNAVTYNKFIAKEATPLVAEFRSALNNIPSFFSTSNYNYWARPIDDTDGIRAGQPNSYGSDYMTLAQWQTFSSLDANSGKSPTAISDTADIHLVYNATYNTKYFTLSAGMVDVANTSYSGNISVLPFSSLVLIGAGTITPAAGSSSGFKLIRSAGGKILRDSEGKVIRTLTE